MAFIKNDDDVAPDISGSRDEFSEDKSNLSDKNLEKKELLNNQEIERIGDNTKSESEIANEDAIPNTTESLQTAEKLSENSEKLVVDKTHVEETQPSPQELNNPQSPPLPSTSKSPPKFPSLPSPTKDSHNSEKICVYNVKWIEYNHKSLPVVTQNENGPCPLLAIMNFLFLQHKISLSPSKTIVESPELTSLLANYILEHVFSQVEPALQENLEQQVSDAISMIPSLVTGLDVNIRFTGIRDFEYTSDIEIFNLLGIPLYHGWLVEPELVAVKEVIKDNSYNQLVVKIVHQRSSDNATLMQEAMIAEEFLNSTASQLTYHGLCELSSALNNQEMGVLFRNNHFLTILKHTDSLYVLATDQGFLNESGVVWESLTNIEGDSHFCDSDFKIFRQNSDVINSKSHSIVPSSSNEQITNDYLMALTLQQDEDKHPSQTTALTDEELARSLQLEEQQRSREAARAADGAEAAKHKRVKTEAVARSQAATNSTQSTSSSSVIKTMKENCVVM